jgi:hypothetical protein
MRALMGARITQIWLDDANRRPLKPRRSRRRRPRTLSAAVALTAVAGLLAAILAHAAV